MLKLFTTLCLAASALYEWRKWNNHSNDVLAILEGFAIQNSIKAIFSNNSADLFPSLNGFRTLAFMWVIVFHSLYYAITTMENLELLFDDALLIMNFVKAAMFAVDIFFTISGFLLAYNICEQHKKTPSDNALGKTFKKIVLRYFRLNPPFLVVSRLL